MNNYISFRSINILILWLFIGIGFSPLYGEELSCGLTSKQADATAATNVRGSMPQKDWLPIHFNAGFYNYFAQSITGNYFGCVRSDGKVFLMTYNASAERLQFAPYDPKNQPQRLSGTKVDNMFQLTFTGKSGEKASLGAEGQLVNNSTGEKASFHVFKFDVGYVGYNNTCYEYDRIWLIEKDPTTGDYYNLDVVWEDENIPVLKRMNEGD